MTAATCEAILPTRRFSAEKPASFSKAKKLRVIQIGSYPATNRGARSNLTTIHERLQTRGHEGMIVDLTAPNRRAKQPGVHRPGSLLELVRLLRDTPADIIHLHIGGSLCISKVALAALVSRLPNAKKICTLHLGGRFHPDKSLRAWHFGASGIIFRRFDGLIAINREIVSFLERVRVPTERTHVITPFPRLRLAESVSLSNTVEAFCRQHTPLIASMGEFEHGYDLPKQFAILNKVRERYPSAGLIAIGSGNLHFKFMYERALHKECNHIELTGTLPEPAISELIHRANVLLHPDAFDSESLAIQEARKAKTPVVGTNEGRRRAAAYLSSAGDVEVASLEVLRALQIARPQYEDAPAALSDGADDVIRLYKQLSDTPEETPVLHLVAGHA